MLDILFGIVLWTITGTIPGYLTEPRRVDAERMTAHIMKECPSCSHAYELAEMITLEASLRGLDPALMAAIAWTESNYQRGLPVGAAGEIGIWQIIPGRWLSGCYDQIRGLSPSWNHLSARSRRKVCRDIRTGTFMAACILAYHLKTCQQHSARCYALYQSGRPPVTIGYQRTIARRAKIVRRRLRGEG